MSEVDLESQISSGDEGAGSEKLVPVSEAIRYRKRAQSAEQDAASLQQQLEASEEKNKQLEGELGEARLESRLVSGLTKAGVNDLEAAVLLAKARMDGADDVDTVIEQLMKEKAYLFEEAGTGVVIAKTASVKERRPVGQSVLERAAKRAASSASRADMHEYMRVRRQFV